MTKQEKERQALREHAILLRVHEKLSAGDVELLKHCWNGVDVDDLCGHSGLSDLHRILWLAHFRLVKLTIDKKDRIFIKTTMLGCELARSWKKGKAA